MCPHCNGRISTSSLLTYLGDAGDHVANVRFERVDSARLLGAAEPDSNTDKGTSSLLGVLLHLLELASDVREVLGHLASCTLDCNFPCFHCAGNCKGRVNKRWLELSFISKVVKQESSHLGTRTISWDLNPVLLQHLPHFAYIFFIK